jgi:hypothetical protein
VCSTPTGGTCGVGQLICGNTCVNVQSDPNNCGNCGVVCTGPVAGSPGVCQNGQCQLTP